MLWIKANRQGQEENEASSTIMTQVLIAERSLSAFLIDFNELTNMIQTEQFNSFWHGSNSRSLKHFLNRVHKQQMDFEILLKIASFPVLSCCLYLLSHSKQTTPAFENEASWDHPLLEISVRFSCASPTSPVLGTATPNKATVKIALSNWPWGKTCILPWRRISCWCDRPPTA